MMRNFHLEGIKVIINYIIVGLIIIMSGIMVEASHNKVVNSAMLEGIEGTHFNYVHRTAFHFQPPRYWINGPMFYKGLYHLFYQYNPHGSNWGDIVWAHSVSPDLINWKALKPAIYMSRPFDINGAWSGSATILPNNRPVILYTGVDSKNRQVQNMAFPANVSDPYLEEWIKPDYNPIIYPSSDMNATKFRDPTTAWYSNGHWKLVVGGVRKNRGMAYLYRSKDFKRWAKAQHPLHSAQNGGMWECPDFYPVLVGGEFGLDTSTLGVNVKHVLKISLDETRYDYYTIGRYDSYRDKYIPDHNLVDGWNGLRYDYGNFYASKTFFDSKRRRRILWGWSNESTSIFQNVVKGWAGIQAIPRSVWLDKNGKQLLTWPVEEVKALRSRNVQLRNYNLKTGKLLEIKGITAAQADVEVEFSLQNLDKAEPFDPKWTNAQDLCGEKGPTVQGGVGPFGLLTLASKNLEEYTPVTFRVFKAHDRHVILMCSDATRSSVNYIDYKPSFGAFVDVDLTDRKFSLKSLIDHSVIESFGFGGKACITSRVYPTIAIMNNAHLYVFNNGSETVTLKKLNAWSMKKPIEMNN